MTRARGARRRPVAPALAGAAVGAALVVAAAAPAGAAAGSARRPADPPVECHVQNASGQCTGENGGDRPGSPGSAASRGPLTCEWRAFEDQAYGHELFPPPENTLAHDGGLIVFYDCGRPQGNGQFDPWERVGANGTLGDGSSNLGHIERPYPWQAPAEIADALWASILVDLPPPEPVVSPPLGRAAIVDHPTFVAVDRWRGVVGPVLDCDGPVCIELTAEPTLVFDPGDGSGAIACEGDGTRFDSSPGAPDPWAQAEGACAHVYERRTRDEPFAGLVATRWEVRWTSSTPDDDGSIPVEPRGVPLPRRVDEVQGIVVSAAGGAG